MQYEWDPTKNRANQAKHGISFEIAVRIFDDPNLLSEVDQVVGGEVRWKSLGIVEGVLLLLLIHTWTDDNVIRVISARKATRHEERQYAG